MILTFLYKNILYRYYSTAVFVYQYQIKKINEIEMYKYPPAKQTVFRFQELPQYY